MRPEATTRNINVELTETETVVLAKKLAVERKAVLELKTQQAVIQKQFKEQVELHEAEITRLALIIDQGFEVQQHDCVISYNDPMQGQKSIFRRDTAELACVEAMTLEEMQEELPLKEKKKND